MANEIRLDIVTPAGLLMSDQVDSVNIPASKGSMGVLKNHAPLMTTLDLGAIKYNKDGEHHFMAVSAGFAEVKDNVVIILADAAEKAEDIDVARAEAAVNRAKERMAAREPETDMVRAELALKRAVNRIKTHDMK